MIRRLRVVRSIRRGSSYWKRSYFVTSRRTGSFDSDIWEADSEYEE